MDALFDGAARERCRQAVGIYGLLAGKFGVEYKFGSKYHEDALAMIESIYAGTFSQRYVIEGRDQYGLSGEGRREAIESCRGNWIKVKSLVLNSYDNLLKVRSPEYMPYGKKFWLELKLPAYFGADVCGRRNCPFWSLVTEPARKDGWFGEREIEDAREWMGANRCGGMLSSFEKIAKMLKFGGHDLRCYWESARDMCGWWVRFRDSLPEAASAMRSRFSGANLAEDYYMWLVSALERAQGENFQAMPWFFRAGSPGARRLTGWFSRYALEISGRDQTLRSLPMSILLYYTADSFERGPAADLPKVEEEVVF